MDQGVVRGSLTDLAVGHRGVFQMARAVVVVPETFYAPGCADGVATSVDKVHALVLFARSERDVFSFAEGTPLGSCLLRHLQSNKIKSFMQEKAEQNKQKRTKISYLRAPPCPNSKENKT